MPKIRTSQARTNRVTTRAILLLFTAFLALGAGVFNLRDRLSQKEVLTDGVVWRDQALGVRAVQVEPGPGSLADVRPGDYLIGISTSGSEPFEVVEEARYVQIYLDQARDQIASGGPLTLSYWIERRNDSGDTVLREGIADLDRLATQETHILRGLYLALIGLIYLGIGIYFLLRQGRAPYLNLFFLICLLAFISHFYSPTIEMRTHFDKMVDFADVAALILLAPLLVHFAAIYPGRQPLPTRRGWLALAGYGPAVLLLGAELMLRFDPLRGLLLFPAVTVRSTLNRIEILLFGLSLLTSGFLFIRTFRGARSVIVRQQLKWVMWGMSIAAVTFAVFYLPSFLAIESVASVLEMTALAPLIMVPVTLGYSIVRYRLMDVDVVMRRSFAYIVATLSVAALFGTVMAVSYEFLRSLIPQEATLLIAAVTMSIIAMLFAPVKNWVQERIDRLFYGEKYDYRLTLQDFGRTLSSTTELDPLLESLVRRLREVFAIEHLAILIEDRGAPSGFRMARSEGVSSEVTLPGDFIRQLREHSSATSIVRIDEMEPEGSEWPRQLERPGIESAGTALTDQPFSYYVPCAVRSRVVAVIALGRLADGALLSSEDLGLLRAISGYVAVAIENSLLLDEQARRARELARLKEFNENIIESITIGVLVISLGGRITNWNSALELIYGLPREKAIGQRVSEVFDPESLRNLRELMKAGDWSAGEQANIYKLRARSFDGRDLILNVSLAPLQSRHEEFAGTLVAIEDVTERIRLEEQLRQNDKLSSIGLLAAGVAHEVNTPLTGISSYSQMLMQQIPESDSRHQLLQKIYRQTSRASSIVNNLLNFSRVSDSRMVAVDLNQVLDDTIQLLESQLHNTRIEVVRDYAGDLPAAPGNAPKLQQVFMNLILNARDAMPNGGELKISTTCADDSIVIVFSDTGEGISPEHLSRIYDPFFTTKQIGKGTGLGLAVSYGIVQDHGGLMTVESRPGEGTLFRIALPLANVQPELVATGD
ncbi:MAG: PAS domain S-box protein [Acidobacteria bacterium]|nr:PAS domain S-box protein [Acidobacteriota bacterium]